MKQEEAIALIEKAIEQESPENWVDLGCGTGTFTTALATLLPAESRIIAVDQSFQNLSAMVNQVQIEFRQADFSKDTLNLPDINGIMMANSLHFVKDKGNIIRRFEQKMKIPKFLIVEYDQREPNQWVPYPINFKTLKELFLSLDYQQFKKLGEYHSIYGGKMMAGLFQK